MKNRKQHCGFYKLERYKFGKTWTIARDPAIKLPWLGEITHDFSTYFIPQISGYAEQIKTPNLVVTIVCTVEAEDEKE